MYRENQIFTRKDIDRILTNVVNKTLGQVDKANVFNKTLNNKKITGIAGDVIEQSVLGYLPDNKKDADILVDGIPVEVKTTGLRWSKKNPGNFEAKEPMSITAVSPKSIINEEFYTSHFWKKLDNILIVYYLYDSDKTVQAKDYAKFPIKGFQFFKFKDDDIQRLKNDWENVKEFIVEIVENSMDPDERLPKLSSELRSNLMCIDTSPKWPNRPRFRLKRTFVNTILQEHFGKVYDTLPESYNSFHDIDLKLKEITEKYRGFTIKEILKEINLPYKINKNGDVDKQIVERIICKLFNSKVKKMRNIDLFSEMGLYPKAITQTKTGTKTEDMKLFNIEFEEFYSKDMIFEQSEMFQDFKESILLLIMFEEPNKDALLLDNKFLGFKRTVFSDDFIDKEVRITWNHIRNLLLNNKLKESVIHNKDGSVRINKNGVLSTELNFPKAKDYNVFLRGTGKDSTKKNLNINGINMYRQNVWIKGNTILDMVSNTEFI